MSDDKERKLDQKRRMLADMRARISRVSDAIDRKAQSIAEAIAREEKIKQTQVRGLESLAAGTDKISDLTDWLKKRIGRVKAWANIETGPELLATLSSLRAEADEIADALKPYGDVWDRDLARQVHLQLCRELLRHLSAHYEYRLAESAGRGGE